MNYTAMNNQADKPFIIFHRRTRCRPIVFTVDTFRKGSHLFHADKLLRVVVYVFSITRRLDEIEKFAYNIPSDVELPLFIFNL
jgi:hypothetical protein